MANLIPILGILSGVIIPLAVFIWLYHENKGKREAVIEIAKHMNDPSKIEDLLTLFDERKKEPVDYRRGGIITLSVGLGIYLWGAIAMGPFFSGIALMVGTIGLGVFVAGYLFPNTSEEITNAVEKFEGP